MSKKVEFYEFDRDQFEHYLYVAQEEILDSLVREGLLDANVAMKYHETHGLIIAKRNTFRLTFEKFFGKDSDNRIISVKFNVGGE